MSEPGAPPSADEIARRVADALETAGIPYALGGAVALAFAGTPRATRDVDVNVFLDTPDADRILGAFKGAGAVVDDAVARRRMEERGDFVASVEGMRVDVFLAFSPVHEEIARRRRREPLRGRPAWVLSPEDLLVFKLIFNRLKDWVDIEWIVSGRKPGFDLPYVRSAFERWVGPGDPRLARLEALVRTYPVP